MAKENVTEEKESMEAREDLAAKEYHSAENKSERFRWFLE